MRTLFIYFIFSQKFRLGKKFIAQKCSLTREHFCAINFYDFRRGLSQQEYVNQLNLTFDDEAPSEATVYCWYSEFNCGRSSLSDEFREGRPKSTVVPENIDTVHEMIKQDRHVTYCEIEASLSISFTSIYAILHEHLAVRKLCSRWIPHNLTIDQKRLVLIGAKK
ncbi:uncharacterized protein LOC136078770 [Hydra vulgaris]|uniref:Uncharacterized protein LOC136078770 n=1 Tax=Hydra vulgaris TaxID=6087 RepID=A0ABM4BNG8_HYDVU